MKNIVMIAAVLGVMFLSSGCSTQGKLGMGEGQCNNPKCQCPKPCECGADCQCGTNGNNTNLSKK